MTVADLRRGIEQLDTAVTAELKRVARETAERIKVGYQQRLNAQLHPGHSGRTAGSARVLDESSHKQFVVNVPGHPSKAANLPMWLEYGTRFMVARPALRAAAAAESDRYVAEMTKAAETAVTTALKGVIE